MVAADETNTSYTFQNFPYQTYIAISIENMPYVVEQGAPTWWFVAEYQEESQYYSFVIILVIAGICFSRSSYSVSNTSTFEANWIVANLSLSGNDNPVGL